MVPMDIEANTPLIHQLMEQLHRELSGVLLEPLVYPGLGNFTPHTFKIFGVFLCGLNYGSYTVTVPGCMGDGHYCTT
jgi:hypothetical protein